MGAWGYRLFQSEFDFDIMLRFSDEVGLDKLQAEAEAKAGFQDGYGNADSGFFYALYCPSDVEAVRKHLEAPNVATGVPPLEEALKKWQAKALGPAIGPELRFLRYCFVLLGACAMTLGCKLSTEILATMMVTFTKAGFMRDALRQLDAALLGPDRYKGEPYHFDSPDLIETVERGGSINVPEPFGPWRGPDDTKLIAEIKARQRAYKLEKEDSNVCGASACEATQEKAGGGLLVCGKCQDRKYCSKECQKEHWKSHKLACAKPRLIEAAFA